MTIPDRLLQQLQKQDLPFVEFMQFALYDPQCGYYTSTRPKLGKAGDFITAPELTPLFSQTLAYQCQEILAALTQPVICEFGAGSGQLCVDLLKQLALLNALPETYYIVELSADLRLRQEECIRTQLPELFSRMVWLQEWPPLAFNGIIIANEVLDAMPVHRFLLKEAEILESFISWRDDKLIEIFKPSTNQQLIEHVKKIPRPLTPYYSEANLFIDGWIKELASALQQGAILLIDYGFPRHEYYHPDRHMGTLMCHYQHQAHPNPLLHIGEQDISAHVDFTHVAEAALAAGLSVAGYTNQAAFLLANGLLNLLESITDTHERLKSTQIVKQLLQPTEMGELFKVMVLTKNLSTKLQGFQLQDKRASL